jgi:hypothetical protein
MQPRKTVAVDLNGTIRDKREASRRMLMEVAGVDIPMEAFSGKSIVEKCIQFQSRRAGGTPRTILPEDWAETNRRLYETDEGFLSSPAIKDATSCLQYFMEHNYEVVIVSSIGGLPERRVYKWLGKYGVPYDRLILTRSGSKTPYYEGCDCVDDELQHLAPVAKKGKLSLLMYPAPGTTGFDFVKNEKLPRYVQAALGWQEAMPYFKHNLAA